MEEGCAVAAGSSRSRAASTIRRFSSKNGGSFIAEENWLATSSRSASRFGLPLGIERLGGKLAIGFLQEDFQAADDLFQASKGTLKVGFFRRFRFLWSR